MASAADIESSLEMREILQLEIQTLTTDEELLDKEIAALRLKKDEMDEQIETQKTQLISGTRRLKTRHVQRLQAEYATQDYNDEMDLITKSFDAKASVYGRLEVEKEILEKELEWKKEDVAEWIEIRHTKALSKEQQLKPKLGERNRLKEELASVEEQVYKLNAEEEEWEKSAASIRAKIEEFKKEVGILENRNEACRQRMRDALQDLDARIAITRQKMNRASKGRHSSSDSEREARWMHH